MYFLTKTYVVTSVNLIRTVSIRRFWWWVKNMFYGEIWLIIHKLSLLPLLIWSAGYPCLRVPTVLLDELRPGPSCSKLTTSLVNVSLKFPKLISEICRYFLLKNCEKLLQCKSLSHFFNKNINVFGYKVIKHLRSWPLNELVKLTMLWTTGPRIQLQF